MVLTICHSSGNSLQHPDGLQGERPLIAQLQSLERENQEVGEGKQVNIDPYSPGGRNEQELTGRK